MIDSFSVFLHIHSGRKAVRGDWRWPLKNSGNSHPSHDKADSRFAPSQWETPLESNSVSHWLGAHSESALHEPRMHCNWGISNPYLDQPITKGWSQPIVGRLISHWLSSSYQALTVKLWIPMTKHSVKGHNQHIEAETRWPPFSRRHFQMHFLEWICGLTGHIATPELARKFNAIFLANIGVINQTEM